MSNSFSDFFQRNHFQDLKENSKQECDKFNRRKEQDEHEVAVRENSARKLPNNQSFREGKCIIDFKMLALSSCW